MSLKLIYGKSGSGKSEYCFKEIAKDINKEKIYLIVPNQMALMAEKKLMEITNNVSLINTEVITFNRMAFRVRNEIGGAKKTNLSKSGKAMLLYDILCKQKDSLNFLGKSSENVDIIGNSITEFKKHRIDINKLREECNNTQDVYLKLKLNDMITMYEEFESSIQNRFLDENDVLDILNNQIVESNQFKDAIIYIDEFVGFTTQEYQIIAKLLQIAKQVNITICTDNLMQNEELDKDIFYASKNTGIKLINIAKEYGIEIEEDVKLKNLYRFKNEELKHLEENFYKIPYKKYEEEPKNIKMFLANNQYSEIEHIATQIVKLVRNEEYRYKDISVITKNLSIYSSLIKVIFSNYNIPVFIDEKRELSENIIVKFLISVLEICNKNWSYESVFNYLKTGFVNIEREEIFKLENYCIRWGIKGNKWYKEDWNYVGKDEYTKEEVDRLNELRRMIVKPIRNLQEKAKKDNTFFNLTKILYEFLQEMKLEETIKLKINKLEEKGFIELANEYETSFKVLIELFDEIVLVFGEEKTNFDKYISTLKIGLKNTGLGKIPATQDEVIVGDVSRSRSHKVKAVFIIGINDGEFPSVYKDEGFFNDKDREYLKEQGFELANGSLENLYEENFNIYKAFTVAEEKLFLSYASSDNEGRTLRPSILITKMKKIYSNLQETSDIISQEKEIITKNNTFDNLIEKLNDYQEGKDVEDIWFDVLNYYENDALWKSRLLKSLEGITYTNIPEQIKPEFVKKLYGETLHTTISRLERYRSCPFSFYLEYGLKLKEKKSLKLDPIDTGSFMHEVIDTFFENVSNKKISIKEIENADIEKIVKQIVEEKLNLTSNYIFKSIPKFIILTNRLCRLVTLSIIYIVQGLKNTDFEVVGNEIEFKNGKEYRPIEIVTKDGKKVEITGKIDRIDLAKDETGKYIRIIDYKSSAKDINLNEVLAGLQLQLITYLDAVCQDKDLIPAGILYFGLVEPKIDKGKRAKDITEEEIEQKLREHFRMNGLVLAEMNIINMMDNKLKDGEKSDVIPVKIKKDGTMDKTSKVVSRKEFEILQKYVKNTLAQISKEILDGNIDIKPYYNVKTKRKPCEYCKYNSICNFKKGFYGNDYNYIDNMEKAYILECMKGDINESK
ncbi:MAG TPA: helicase-exonuclease AddAB subunit AddB [Clostridiaceae bacterium]|jgi:ATP-dependent helicase/nuclease subunit B|nr:helicase-exonuclease AddAB subunit AddB [Clostridium sp.]HJJ11827.1 helicase-exonuclease AddAB subunit AddB [Clostridiaceae bacterium]